MLNYAPCQYVVTRVTTYHSCLVDLSRSRSVHAVEHQPCCPDPQLLVASDCKAVHYGLCSPLLKLPSFTVGPTSPIKTAPPPPRGQPSASTAARLDLDALDPVELLAADLEGKLEALVNSFVAQDKVRLAARKSKTAAVPSSSVAKRSSLTSSASGAASSKTVPSFSGNSVASETEADGKGGVPKKCVNASDKAEKSQKDKCADVGGGDVRKDRPVPLPSVTMGATKKETKPVRVSKDTDSKTSKADLPVQALPVQALLPESDTSMVTAGFGASSNSASKPRGIKPVAKLSSVVGSSSKDKNSLPETVANSDHGNSSPASLVPSAQRTVFKVSPPSKISLVTGTPKTTTAPSFSATYVPTVTTSQVTPVLTTTDSVKLRTTPAKNPKEPVRPSSYPGGPKENGSKASSQPMLAETSSKPASMLNSQILDAKTASIKHHTSSAVDYAKARFQSSSEPNRFDELLKQRPRNGHVVNDAKSRWEPLTAPEHLWSAGGESSGAIEQERDMDSPLSTSPRRLNSPDGLYLEGAPTIPHPKLTSSQKQHIRERSLSPTDRTHTHVPVRPFLTKGSVAERVLLFERCPERNLERTPAPAKNKPTVYSTWKHGSTDAQVSLQVSFCFLHPLAILCIGMSFAGFS